MHEPRTALIHCLMGCALALACLAGPAQARVIVRERTQYFTITGTTGPDLMKSLVREGRKNIDVPDSIAGMVGRIDIQNIKGGLVNGRCAVTDVTIVLNIRYVLPKWRQNGKTRPELRRAWKRLSAELVKHEKTHARIARDAASEFEAELRRTSGTPAFRCGDFAPVATMRLTNVYTRMKRRNAAFDRKENLDTSLATRLQVDLMKIR